MNTFRVIVGIIVFIIGTAAVAGAYSVDVLTDTDTALLLHIDIEGISDTPPIEPALTYWDVQSPAPWRRLAFGRRFDWFGGSP